MSYEVEHSTTPANNNNTTNDPSNPHPHPQPRRPDLSSFFATLQEITPNPSEIRTRPYAVPVPGDISAAYRSLAEALNVMRHQTGDNGFPVHDGRDEGLGDVAENEDATGGVGLLSSMIGLLLREAEMPPREVEGVGESFCDALERISTSSLKPSQACPICSNPFLDDPYPLVVRLPCHTSHLFDLECVRPWLRLRGTCPLDRTDFGKKERERERERIERLKKKRSGNGDGEDEDEEWDGMYG
ncbi:RING superfamily domain-containing protein [Histoplasma ohiense]|nr:RING superfamily domain-containing protein [Histoplasma ohiense (nom. inval.)]